jgi:hypothetical protein
MRCDRPCLVHIYTSGDPIKIGYEYVKGWGYEINTYPQSRVWSLALRFVWEKWNTPARLWSTLLYFPFNIELWMEFSKDWAYDHDITLLIEISLMLDLEIIECHVFWLL